jgi:YVTN family beta-propeller protein
MRSRTAAVWCAAWLAAGVGCSDSGKGGGAGDAGSDADTDTDTDADTDTDTDTDVDTDTDAEVCSGVTTLELLPTGTAPEGDGPSAIEFTPDGARIVVAHRDSKNVTVFDAAQLQDVFTIPVTGSPNDLAIAPDGATAITANIFEGTASIVDLVAAEETGVVDLGCEQPGVVEFAPDGSFAVVVCTVDSLFQIVDLATATVSDSYLLEGIGGTTSFGSWAIAYGFTRLAITPDSSALIVPLPYAEPAGGVMFVDLDLGSTQWVATADTPWSVALSGDGLIAVVAHGDPSAIVTVIDTALREVTAEIPTGAGSTMAPAIALDAAAVKAAVAVPNSVRIVDLESGTASGDLTSGTPGSLHTTADGAHCFVGAWDGPLLDFASESVVATLLDSTTPDLAAAAKVGSLAATAHILRKETMEVVDVDAADPHYVEEVPTGEPPEGDKARRVAVGATGELAVVIHNHSKNAAIVDLAALEVLDYAALGERPGEVALTPDGAVAVVTNLDESFVSVVEIGSGDTLEIPLGFRAGQVEISPDGAYAYVAVLADGDGVWRMDLEELGPAGAKLVTGDMGGVAGGFDASSGMRLSHDGATLVTCNSFSDTISVIDTAAWAVVATVPVGAFPVRAEFSPDDAEIYVTSWEGGALTVVANDGAGSAAIETIASGTNPLELAVAPDGDAVYVADYTGKAVLVVDLGTGEVSDTIPLPETSGGGEPIDLALSAGGGFLFAACNGGDVHRIDTAAAAIAETVAVGLAPAQLVYSAATGCAHVPAPLGDDGLAVICFCQ